MTCLLDVSSVVSFHIFYIFVCIFRRLMDNFERELKRDDAVPTKRPASAERVPSRSFPVQSGRSAVFCKSRGPRECDWVIAGRNLTESGPLLGAARLACRGGAWSASGTTQVLHRRTTRGARRRLDRLAQNLDRPPTASNGRIDSRVCRFLTKYRRFRVSTALWQRRISLLKTATVAARAFELSTVTHAAPVSMCQNSTRHSDKSIRLLGAGHRSRLGSERARSLRRWKRNFITALDLTFFLSFTR